MRTKEFQNLSSKHMESLQVEWSHFNTGHVCIEDKGSEEGVSLKNVKMYLIFSQVV
jgi:hypothetical protein